MIDKFAEVRQNMVIKQLKHRDIEDEGDHAVGRHGPADGARSHRHVRNLRRRADGEGEIDEVPIAWIAAAGKAKATTGAAMLGVIFVRVMQREHHMDEQPGEQRGQEEQPECARLYRLALRGRAQPEDDGP